MKTKEATAEGYCRIRKSILAKGLAVPIGDKHASPCYDLQYRWKNDEEFQVLYLGEWQEAEVLGESLGKYYIRRKNGEVFTCVMNSPLVR